MTTASCTDCTDCTDAPSLSKVNTVNCLVSQFTSVAGHRTESYQATPVFFGIAPPILPVGGSWKRCCGNNCYRKTSPTGTKHCKTITVTVLSNKLWIDIRCPKLYTVPAAQSKGDEPTLKSPPSSKLGALLALKFWGSKKSWSKNWKGFYEGNMKQNAWCQHGWTIWDKCSVSFRCFCKSRSCWRLLGKENFDGNK